VSARRRQAPIALSSQRPCQDGAKVGSWSLSHLRLPRVTFGIVENDEVSFMTPAAFAQIEAA
jgi:hypothetical protein